MTDLQRTEFEILKEIVRVCDELELTYFLVCGSALGAAKYKGFIPWDDDVDVALPREDYRVFCEKAQSMLPEHLFLQNHRTDPFYPLIFSKVRNSNTTFVEKSYGGLNINHGIYVDVFPLDGYPEEIHLQDKLEKEKHRYIMARLCCINVPRTWKTALLVAWQKLCGIHRNPAKIVSRVEDHLSQYSTDESKLWCNHGNWQKKLEYAPREQYGEGQWAEFEGLRVRIPEKIDAYLTQKYGSWRDDPPKSDMEGHHYNYICDTERSYKEYVVKISERKIRLKTEHSAEKV